MRQGDLVSEYRHSASDPLHGRLVESGRVPGIVNEDRLLPIFAWEL